METIIKSFVGMFFALLLLLLGAGLIAASVNSRNAGAFAADCASRIENSDFAGSVIEECRRDATDRGYELTVEVSEKAGQPEVKYGSLQLEYPFRIPLTGIARTNVTQYAIR